MNVTAVNGDKAGLKERTTWFATSALVELSGRLYLDMFQLGRVLFQGIDLHLKLFPSCNMFFIKERGSSKRRATGKI